MTTLNYNQTAKVINLDNLEKEMMNQSFFNNDDYTVRKMKQNIDKQILKFSFSIRMEMKKLAEQINSSYEMTNRECVISGKVQPTPKQYIYSMIELGWDGMVIFGISPYLTDELQNAVLKYFVSPK